MAIDPVFSKNINVLKVLAIIGIAFGHFWHQQPTDSFIMRYWWVTSAIGLIIFSHTSGFFTAIKYAAGFDFRSFWINKVYRIGIPLTVINLTLLALFLIQGRENIASVQTVASWLGLHGLWTFLHIPHVGPYGLGLWFLTLLIIFYLAYPLIEWVNRDIRVSSVFTLGVVVACLVLDRITEIGYTLWLTTAGFFIGVWDAKHGKSISKRSLFGAFFVALILLVFCKVLLSMKIASGVFILVTAYIIVKGAEHVTFNRFAYQLILPMSSWVLIIYIIHMYSFVRFSGVFFIDWAASLTIILVSAFLIDTISGRLLKTLKE